MTMVTMTKMTDNNDKNNDYDNNNDKNNDYDNDNDNGNKD